MVVFSLSLGNQSHLKPRELQSGGRSRASAVTPMVLMETSLILQHLTFSAFECRPIIKLENPHFHHFLCALLALEQTSGFDKQRTPALTGLDAHLVNLVRVLTGLEAPLCRHCSRV